MVIRERGHQTLYGATSRQNMVLNIMIMLTAEHSHFSDCTLFYDMLYYNLLTCFNVLKFNLIMLNYNLGPRPINSMFLFILQGSIIIKNCCILLL